MNPRPGNFAVQGDKTTLNELGVGEFGYVAPYKLCVLGHRAYLSPDVEVRREHLGLELLVTKTSNGVQVEFIGFTEHHWTHEPASPGMLRVMAIIAGRKRHTKWSKALQYTSLDDLEIGKSGFVYRHAIEKNSDGTATTHLGVEVEQKGNGRMVHVRRLSVTHYEVELHHKKWTTLLVN